MVLKNNRRRRRKTNNRSIVKVVKKLIAKEVEVKHRLVTTNGQISDIGYAIAPLDFVAPGVNVNERVGSRIRLKSLYLNGRFTSAQGTNPTNTFMRYFCVETRRPLQITAGTSYDIRPLFDTTGVTIGNALASFDYDWVKKVHWNKVVYLNAYANNNVDDPVPILKRMNAYAKMNLNVIYDQDTNPPAVNFPKTYLYYGFVQDQSTTTTHATGVMKLRYTDA